MPGYLSNPSAGNIRVEIPTITLSSDGDYIEFSGFANADNEDDRYEIFGMISGFNSRLILDPAELQVKANGGSTENFSSGYTQPSVGTDFIIRMQHNGSGYDASLDGTIIGTHSRGDLDFTINSLLSFNSTGARGFKGGMYYFKAGTSGGLTRDYDPALSSGSSTALVCKVDSDNNGTIVNYATDGSQWLGGNEVPTANAGSSVTVIEGEEFQLDGSGSSDSDGTVASYAWAQTAGTTTALSDATVVNPTATRGVTGTGETLTYSLVVTDDAGGESVANTVNVVVSAIDEIAPVAATNGNQSNLAADSTVTLDGTDSTDEDGTIASYAWTQTSGDTVSLTNADSATATYTAPDIPEESTLVFLLTITDNDGNTGTASVTHNIEGNGAIIPIDLDTAPLTASISLSYIGAFYGANMPSAQPSFCISEDSATMFAQGRDGVVVQFAMPTNLVDTATGGSAELMSELQRTEDMVSSSRINLGITDRFRITGIMEKDGRLFINYIDWYDNAGTQQTTFIFSDSSDLENCVVYGPFGLEGQARTGGVMQAIPPEYLEFFGGDFIGGAPNGSISNRFDMGPSLRSFQSTDFTNTNVGNADNYISVSGIEFAGYPFGNGEGVNGFTGFYELPEFAEFTEVQKGTVLPENIELEKSDGTFTKNDWWTTSSKSVANFVIPGTKTLCVVAGVVGGTREPYYTDAVDLPTDITQGIGYKTKNWSYDADNNTYVEAESEAGGYSARIADDAYHNFFLFNLDDYNDAKNGDIELWEVRPYYVGQFKGLIQEARGGTVAIHTVPEAGTFDYNSNILYLCYHRIGGVGQYDYSPLWAAIDVNSMADLAKVTNGGVASTKPVITVSGNSTTTVTESGTVPTFTASALDNDGNNITDDIVVSGDTVDTDVPATYVIRYNVVDSEGEAANQVVRTVIVEEALSDDELPVITVSGEETTTVTQGDDAPVFVATALDNLDGDISSSVIVTGSVDTSTIGSYDLTFAVEDAAGNFAIEVIRTIIVQEVGTSTLNLSLTGIPNGTYSVRVINKANNALSFTQNVTFTDSTASLSISVAASSAFEYFTVDGDAYGLSVTGVTV